MKKRKTLNIRLNGITVGKLEKLTSGGLIFTYHQDWILNPQARPISLSMPLVTEPFKGDIVFNFFDHLLPDNPQIRARIQAKFNVPTNQAFDLLASIGHDCVGAIQLTEKESIFEKKIECKIQNEQEISEILKNYISYPLGMSENIKEFRISIAGAQEKTALLYYKKKWHIPLNDTPTTHILKLPIGVIKNQNIDLSESSENEWLCAQIAAAFGLPTAKCEILHFKEVKVLSVERFDRKMSEDKNWIIRLPQEDMCQALGFSPHLKYQAEGGPGIKEIMQFLLGSVESEKDRENFYRTQILFWLLAAIDGHAKNFSVFIEVQGKYRLTPLYDIMSAYPLIAKKQLQAQKIKMAMALKGKNNHYHWHNVQRRHFIETAKHCRFSPERAEQLLDEMLSQVDTVIKNVSSKLPASFPTSIADAIFEGMHLKKEKLNNM